MDSDWWQVWTKTKATDPYFNSGPYLYPMSHPQPHLEPQGRSKLCYRPWKAEVAITENDS